MEKKTQLTLLLENRVGALAEVVKLLAKAKANIEAISISDGVHHGVLRLVTPDLEAARRALKDGGISFSEQRVYALRLQDRPGALAEACKELAAQGTNLDFVYGSTCSCREEGCSCGCEGLLFLSCAEPAELEKQEGGGKRKKVEGKEKKGKDGKKPKDKRKKECSGR